MTARKNFLMYKLFGFCKETGKHCKDCEHLLKHVANRTYYKCECYGDTSSEASDWRVGSPACGLFNKPYNGNPVIRMVTTAPDPEEQIEGQMTIFDVWNDSDLYGQQIRRISEYAKRMGAISG